MKLRDHKRRKVTDPDFLGKFSFSQKCGKRAQKGTKIGFLDFCAKLIWLANFLHKSHIWENSRSLDLGQKGQK